MDQDPRDHDTCMSFPVIQETDEGSSPAAEEFDPEEVKITTEMPRVQPEPVVLLSQLTRELRRFADLLRRSAPAPGLVQTCRDCCSRAEEVLEQLADLDGLQEERAQAVAIYLEVKAALPS